MDPHMTTTTLKAYTSLTKPGIIFGNAVTAVSGFLLASQGIFNVELFIATIAGLSLLVASGCVWNNYIDRQMDEKMARTRKRAFVQKLVTVPNALSFGIVLGLIGLAVLAYYTNPLATYSALFGFFVYVALYSPLKYKTSFATVVGSISGAIPPVVGYTAVSGSIDLACLILFSIVVFWQMPHFYAIAMFRFDDYKAAGIPVLPVSKGMYVTKVYSLLNVIAFTIAASLLSFCGYTSYSYLSVILVLGVSWLWLSIEGFSCSNDRLWARRMFFLSLFIIMALAFMIACIPK